MKSPLALSDSRVHSVDMSNAVISSQRYRDEAIVEEKRAAKDYTVTTFDVEVQGVVYSVVTDGHHSYEAALLDGVEPAYEAADGPLASEYRAELESVGAGEWLAAHNNGDEYYFLASGQLVW